MVGYLADKYETSGITFCKIPTDLNMAAVFWNLEKINTVSLFIRSTHAGKNIFHGETSAMT